MKIFVSLLWCLTPFVQKNDAWHICKSSQFHFSSNSFDKLTLGRKRNIGRKKKGIMNIINDVMNRRMKKIDESEKERKKKTSVC